MRKRKLLSSILKWLLVIICLTRSSLQVITYIQHPDLFETALLLINAASILIIALQVVSAYLVLEKPFLGFLSLIIVMLIQLLFFPLGAALAVMNGMRLSADYWTGFMITASVHAGIALLAYLSWRISRRNKEGRIA